MGFEKTSPLYYNGHGLSRKIIEAPVEISEENRLNLYLMNSDFPGLSLGSGVFSEISTNPVIIIEQGINARAIACEKNGTWDGRLCNNSGCNIGTVLVFHFIAFRLCNTRTVPILHLYCTCFICYGSISFRKRLLWNKHLINRRCCRDGV